MGCSSSKTIAPAPFTLVPRLGSNKSHDHYVTVKSAIVIQKWFRKYQASLRYKKAVSWSIFQRIEYIDESQQLSLSKFFSKFSEHATAISDRLRMDSSSHQASSSIRKSFSIPLSQLNTPFHANDGDDVTIDIEFVRQLIAEVIENGLITGPLIISVLKRVSRLFLTQPNVRRASAQHSRKITVIGTHISNERIDDNKFIICTGFQVICMETYPIYS